MMNDLPSGIVFYYSSPLSAQKILKNFDSTTRLLAACLLGLAACACSPPPEIPRGEFPLPEGAEIVEGIEVGHYGGIFILTETTQPTTFNYYVPSNLGTVSILGQIFDTLVDFNPMEGEIVPALAERWEIGEDERTYTFHLRKGLRWADGEPFTADDVVFTIEVILADETDPKTDVTRPLYPTRYYSELMIDGEKIEVKKIDDYTVQFRTPTVYAPFLYDMMSMPILPRHQLLPFHQKRDFMKAWTTQTAIETPEAIVGTGPFMVESYRPGERLILRPNPHYWKADSTGQRLPYLDRLIYKFVSESNTEVVYFATGQSSMGGVGPADVAWVRQHADTYDYSVYPRGPTGFVTMIWFNQNTGRDEKGRPYVEPTKLGWFQNKHFRQALYYAFDREAVIDAVFFGRGQPLDSMIPASQGAWHNPDVRKYRYNPEKARSLLRKEGFTWGAQGRLHDPDGIRVEFDLMLPSGGSWEDLIVTFKENLDAIGIQLNLNPIDFSSMLRKINYTFDYDASVIGWGSNSAAYDPSGSKAFYLSEGIYHVWHPRQEEPATEWEARIDALFKEQEKTLDADHRIANMHAIQAILAEEVPMLLMASVDAYVGVQNRWRNVIIPPAGSTAWNIETYWTPKPRAE